MRRLLIILIIACAMVLPMGEPCYALSTPHIVIGDGVWLLERDSGIRIFLLPATYYAKIDNLDNDFYYITFNGVSGKVEKSLVSSVGYHTQAAGTMQELSIDPQYSDFSAITLKSSMDSSQQEFQVPTTEKFIFLGKYPLSEMWYCVRTGDKIGYIKASRTSLPELDIPAFVPEASEDAPAAVENPTESPANQKILRVVIIASVCFAGLILIFLMFKPQKSRKKKYYYDDDD